MHAFRFSMKAVDATAAETLRAATQAVFDTHVADKAPEPHADGIVHASQSVLDGSHHVGGNIRCETDHSADLKSSIASVAASAPELISSGPIYEKHTCNHDLVSPTPCVNEVF